MPNPVFETLVLAANRPDVIVGHHPHQSEKARFLLELISQPLATRSDAAPGLKDPAVKQVMTQLMQDDLQADERVVLLIVADY